MTKYTSLAKQDFSRSIHVRQLTHKDITISYLNPDFYKYNYKTKLLIHNVKIFLVVSSFMFIVILLSSIMIGLGLTTLIFGCPIPILLIWLIFDTDSSSLNYAKSKYKLAYQLENVREIINIKTSVEDKKIKIVYVDMLGYKNTTHFTFDKLTKREVYNDGSKPSSEFWDLTENYMEYCKSIH